MSEYVGDIVKTPSEFVAEYFEESGYDVEVSEPRNPPHVAVLDSTGGKELVVGPSNIIQLEVVADYVLEVHDDEIFDEVVEAAEELSEKYDIDTAIWNDVKREAR